MYERLKHIDKPTFSKTPVYVWKGLKKFQNTILKMFLLYFC